METMKLKRHLLKHLTHGALGRELVYRNSISESTLHRWVNTNSPKLTMYHNLSVIADFLDYQTHDELVQEDDREREN